MLGVDHRILLFVETAVDRIASFDALDDVGDVVVAPVGQDGREIGHLQRRAAQFALPDRERDDRQCVPQTVIDPVVVFARRDVARPFVQKVGFQLAAEAEAVDVGFPHVEAVFDVFVTAVFEDVAQHVAEIGVARVGHRPAQVERRGVGMAFHHAVAVAESAVAGVAVRRREHALLQSDEPLHQLEGRPRRIFRLHGAVEHRLTFVVEHFHVVVAPVAAYHFIGVERGRGDHHQDLARRRLDRHGGTHLAPHQLFGEGLQAGVDRRDDVVARFGQ